MAGSAPLLVVAAALCPAAYASSTWSQSAAASRAAAFAGPLCGPLRGPLRGHPSPHGAGTHVHSFCPHPSPPAALRLGGGRASAIAAKGSSGGSEDSIVALTDKMMSAAKSATPFTPQELDRAVGSLELCIDDGSVDLEAYRCLVEKAAHHPHKDWERTEAGARELAGIVGGCDDPAFRSIFERVLEGGNWDAAVEAAAARPAGAKPWAVLVTGVNGIRKTSSVYQPWFKDVLKEALGGQYGGDASLLPDGGDSFYRQLDFMITTVANKEFRDLYSVEDIGLYAARKDGIFTRYRTLAEMVGVLLLREAQRKRASVMVETSGRDVAMFRYVDQFFPGDDYNKLVIHFTINDISHAEASVDTRMEKEMRDGQAARDGDTRSLIRVNAGGPYGSAVLKGVQSDSKRVWEGIRAGTEGDVGKSWYKACVSVEVDGGGEWSVRAEGSDRGGNLFGPPRH